ncbi:hypothetical protein HUN01_07755 [Nostoc edaphicum CCNP1411]|uniref:Uncharacterized protein n=1 Tax=Nostoc edaphicum CCNP1411 TaxID=1472755 RepID=A0A7D7QCY4_9NOSO|nr:hypothetical protein [Nostoc edaphicum]QMS87479.1 hypothetical protein HUN01_07755 [Nostoc edaphicum CCNP1411]
MVERPIKKSERQAQGSTDNNSENSDSVTPIESNPKSSKPSRDRSSGGGKKSSYKDEVRQPVNLALARGPKPVKPPAAKVKTEELETESESESTSEESQD